MEIVDRKPKGRPKADGERHMYTVGDDVHEWIIKHGGGQYITDIFRIIMAVSEKNKYK